MLGPPACVIEEAINDYRATGLIWDMKLFKIKGAQPQYSDPGKNHVNSLYHWMLRLQVQTVRLGRATLRYPLSFASVTLTHYQCKWAIQMWECYKLLVLVTRHRRYLRA